VFILSVSIMHSFSLIPSSAGNDNSDSKRLLLLVLWLLDDSGVYIKYNFVFSLLLGVEARAQSSPGLKDKHPSSCGSLSISFCANFTTNRSNKIAVVVSAVLPTVSLLWLVIVVLPINLTLFLVTGHSGLLFDSPYLSHSPPLGVLKVRWCWGLYQRRSNVLWPTFVTGNLSVEDVVCLQS
jgi:hypothetical protein